MKTWEDYKTYVTTQGEDAQMIQEVEVLSSLVSTMIARRTDMGLTQRALAEKCGIPQSSVARMESMKTTPNLLTMLRVLHQLGLTLSITTTKNHETQAR